MRERTLIVMLVSATGSLLASSPRSVQGQSVLAPWYKLAEKIDERQLDRDLRGWKKTSGKATPPGRTAIWNRSGVTNGGSRSIATVADLARRLPFLCRQSPRPPPLSRRESRW